MAEPMLDADELLASPLVANATMNRGRGLSGVNSYERDLRFAPLPFLAARAEARGEALWYDACCGQGRALAEAGRQIDAAGWGSKVRLVGADLAGMFVSPLPPRVQFVQADAVAYSLGARADLITCVHGLHYLGDKLAFLQNAYAQLAPGGLFLGSLDAANVCGPGGAPIFARLARRARRGGVRLELKGQVLHLERTGALLDFRAVYRGAAASARPHASGITVIESWYDVR